MIEKLDTIEGFRSYYLLGFSLVHLVNKTSATSIACARV